MKRFILALLVIGSASCAPPPPNGQAPTASAAGDCFNVSLVQGFSSVDDDMVRVDAGPGASYDLDIAGAQCRQIDWAQRIALESTTSSFLCVGKSLGQGNVYFRDPASRRRLSCYIEEVRRSPPKAGD
jgi:hypothetical protein